MPYADAFKAQMVKRVVGPGAVSPGALAKIEMLMGRGWVDGLCDVLSGQTA